MATVVWANGAGGIVIPMLIGVAAGVICLVSAFRAGAAKRIVAAYAQGRLDTESFLERLDPCARAALSFRMAVICLGPAVMACVIAAAFPGRVVAAPIAAPEHPAVSLLQDLEPDSLTPRQALEALYRLRQLL